MNQKFDKLFHKLLTEASSRGHTNGLRAFDIVKFKKNTLENEYIKNKPESYKERIKLCQATGFDKNLVVTNPNSKPHVIGATGVVAQGDFVDIAIETSYGNYQHPMTVPVDVLERAQGDGINTNPVPDSNRLKNKNIDKPEKLQHKSDADFDTNLTTKNVKLPNGENWDDAKPGGGVKVKKDYSS